MARYHIRTDGTPGVCSAEPGNCPLGSNTPHFDSYEEAQRFTDMKNEALAHKEGYLKEYNELFRGYRGRIQELREFDEDMTELLNIIINEKAEKSDYKLKGDLTNIVTSSSFLTTRHLRTGKLIRIENPEDFLAYGTEFERGENRELLRSLMTSKIDNHIYGDVEADLAQDYDIRYEDRFYKDPKFAAMLFTIDDLNNIEHYRENPMVAERDLERINERIPNYTKYRAYKGFHSRMSGSQRSAAERTIDTLVEMRDTKNYDIIREQPLLVDPASRESLEVAANFRKRTFEISKRMEYLRERLRAIGEDV